MLHVHVHVLYMEQVTRIMNFSQYHLKQLVLNYISEQAQN